MLNEAIGYAKKGWRVFPLKENAKAPATSDGFKSATTDIEQITKWWKQNPKYNIGIATGQQSGISVIDIDGKEAMKALTDNGITDRPETLTHKTIKGFHYILLYNPIYPQGAGFLEKLDIRNEGGYIVAPPSEIDGQKYSVYKDKDVSTWDSLSQFFRSYDSQNRQRDVSENKTVPEQPTWVTEYLTEGVPEGQRNDAGIRLAGYFRKKGIAEDMTIAIMQQFRERCSPPMKESELLNIVKSAWRYQISDTSYQGQGLESPIVDVNIANKRVFRWLDAGFSIEASRINMKNDGIHCWIRIGIESNPHFYGPVRINLLSSSARTSLIRQLNDREQQNWLVAIDQVAKLVADSIDPRSEAIDMRHYTPESTSPWMMRPFARVKQPSLIMGMGGEGKSTVGIAILLSVALGHTIIPGTWVESNPKAVLMLDWESSKDEFYYVKNALLYGANKPEPNYPIMYKKMAGSLVDHMDDIQRDISENMIELVLVDSIVASAGQDVNDAEAARIYFECMNMLDISSIGITHTKKSGDDNTPFGSIFYWNYARNIWKIEKQQEQGENFSTIGLFHKKGNRTGGLLNPIGLSANFEVDDNGNTTSIHYSEAELAEYENLVTKLPVKQQILALLKNGIPLTPVEISEQTNVANNTIRTTLKRMLDRNEIKHNDSNQYYVTKDATQDVTPVTKTHNEPLTPFKGGDGGVSETQQDVTKKLWNPKGW